jgi:hypothetical protein
MRDVAAITARNYKQKVFVKSTTSVSVGLYTCPSPSDGRRSKIFFSSSSAVFRYESLRLYQRDRYIRSSSDFNGHEVALPLFDVESLLGSFAGCRGWKHRIRIQSYTIFEDGEDSAKSG